MSKFLNLHARRNTGSNCQLVYEGGYSVLMEKSCSVTKGVQISGTRNGVPFEAQPISRTC